VKGESLSYGVLLLRHQAKPTVIGCVGAYNTCAGPNEGTPLTIFNRRPHSVVQHVCILNACTSLRLSI
jgi:hypothetical protein